MIEQMFKLNVLRASALAFVVMASLSGGVNAATLLEVGDVRSDAAGKKWVFVGSWKVHDGPDWRDPVPFGYSGQEAAALLFGGSPDEYAISTSDSMVTHTAFMSIWGIAGTHENSEFYKVDTGAPGYDEEGDSSAYVNDNSTIGNENLAFVAVIPEPSSALLLGLGVLAFAGRRQRMA